MNIRARVIMFTSILLMIVVWNVPYVSGTSYEWAPLNDNLPVPGVHDLVISALDNQIIYALTDAGIYRMTNEESNWVKINKGLEGYDIFSIYVDSRNPEMVYAGSYGIFKSENHGDLWTKLALELSSRVNCIRTDPSNSDIIYIGTESEGVFKSTDSGKTWNPVNQGLKKSDLFDLPEVKTILFNSSDTNVVYLGTNRGVFKSSDGGKSWTEINNGLKQITKAKIQIKPGVFAEVDIEVTPIVFSGEVNLTNASNIYLCTNSGFFVTENGGENWSSVSELGTLLVNKVVTSKTFDKVFIGTEKGLFMSCDSGKTWQKFGQDALDKKINGLIVDFVEPVKIYVGTDEGVFKSVDYGNSFSPLNSSLVHVDISHIYSGGSYDVIFVSALRDGLFKSLNSGKNWIHLKDGLENLSVISAAIDPNNNQIVFVGTDDGIYISKDGGVTFDLSSKRLEGCHIYKILFVNSEIILAGTSYGIYKSEDGGFTWKSSNSGIEENYFACVCLEFDPQKHEYIYAGTVDRGIYKSENSGESWISLNNNLETPYAPVNVIKIDPENSSVIYLGTEGNGLLKSGNGGLSWTKLETVPSPWVKDLAINSLDTRNIFIVLYPSLILESRDGGGTWNDITFNLPSKDISSILFVGKVLFIGTKTGVYKLIASYTLTASSSAGGFISPSGTINIGAGESRTFLITSSAGYKVKDVRIDGISVGSVSSYTFSSVTSDHTISVFFEREVATSVTIIVLQIDKKNFTVNGSTRTLDSPPIIKNNRTLLPIRAVVEAFGGTVSWDAAEKKVTVSLGSTTIELRIGKSIAKVNGVDIPIDPANAKVVPEIINGRTMLPLRFVTENLGCDVNWDGTTKTITITYKH